MRYFTVFFFLFSLTLVNAQEDSLHYKWLPSGVVGLNISQVALSNWTQGGDDAMSFNLYGNFSLNYSDPNWNFNNNLKLTVGKTKLGDEESKTTDNEIFMDNVLSNKAGWIFDPYVSSTFKSVIVNGFAYQADTSFQNSQFFDPAYLNQGVGLTYQKLEGFTTRLGLGFQETFASKFAEAFTDDPATTPEIEKSKFETGIEFVTKAEYPIQDNLLFKSELFMFGAFDDLAVWDVRWDNTITAKISEIINVNLNVLIIYDEDQIKTRQIKEALQLGISYTLF